jgi:outer membrane receptor protein involved in Fe transport
LTSFRIRGLRSSTSTDGFRTGVGGHDTYNVERVGSTRGPNSILFGTGAPGGMLNFQTKSANAVRHANHVELKIGDYETHRAAFDLNRVLVKDRFALRLMGVYDNEGSAQPYQFTRKKSATLAAHYAFKADSILRVSYEHTRVTGVSGRKWGPLDNITKFLASLDAGDVVWDPTQERYETRQGAVVGAAAGVGSVANRTLLVYGPELGTPTLREGATSAANRNTLATNASVFTGAVVPIAPEWITPLGKVTAPGGAEYGKIDYHVATATFTHRLADQWYVELAANQSGRHSLATLAGDPTIAADLDYRLPGGALNPYFFGNGYYFMQIPSFLRQGLTTENLTFRASTSYDLNLGKRWGFHRIAAMAERNINNYRRDRLREARR